MTSPLSRVLVANRGEIARRIVRAVHDAGLTAVAVYTSADAASAHVREADEAVALAADGAGYLDVDELVDVACQVGADAIHPGYGFLSENPAFAAAVEAAGLVFVGPTAEQIELFGSKSRARELADSVGVASVPGTGVLTRGSEAAAAAQALGYPVMVKAVAGGGGMGVQRCDEPSTLADTIDAVSSLSARLFGNGDVFLEKAVIEPRHVEVQVVGDGKGGVSVLGDRDCSLQRRHQKVMEEAPAQALSDDLRARLWDDATRIAAAVHYRSVGTVEFLVAGEDSYFLEANTRLQVEHPVTEQVTKLDLVGLMLAIAGGDLVLPTATQVGHAVEARLCAEDVFAGSRPSSGLVTQVVLPSGDGIRVESGIESGDVVTTDYDSLLVKVIATGKDRDEAFSRLAEGLDAMRIDGIETNLPLVRALARSAAVVAAVPTTATLATVDVADERVTVVRAGMSTTLQDWPGRVGHWQVGVPPSGPFDDLSMRRANRLVGNPEGATAFEATMLGPVLAFSYATTVAVTGAPAPVTLDGEDVPQWRALEVRPGQRLQVGTPSAGARTYIAVAGGIDVPQYLGSASTFEAGGFGGHGGRALRLGDVLRPGAARTLTPEPSAGEDVPDFGHTWELHVAEGPQPAPEYFTREAIDELYQASWRVHVHAARTGVRLLGPKPTWSRPDGGEAGLHPSNLHDNPYSVGAINFTGDTPSILGPDGPSLGGFACPVTVVSPDRWKLGQLRPGDTVRLVPVDETTLDGVRAARAAAVAFVPSHSARDADEGVLSRRDAHAGGPEVVYRRGGDDNLLVEYGPMELDLGLRMRVHALMEALSAHAGPGLIDVTPGIRSLHLHVDADRLSVRTLHGLLEELEDTLPPTEALSVPSREVRLPMSWDDPVVREAIARYEDLIRDDAPWNPDNIEFIRRINGLDSVDDVRRTVFDASYMVLGLGDVYLGAPAAAPIDPRHRLVTTKYNPARTWTAAGTVGIGGSYMCIYGMDSPGGYQLVGRTLPIWAGVRQSNPNFAANAPWLLRFFDRIRFEEVDADTLAEQRLAFAAGRLEIEVEDGEFSLAEHREFLDREASSITEFRQRQAVAFAEERAAWEAAGEFSATATEPEPTASAVVPAIDVPEGAIVCEAPMAGSVWRVPVQPGQTLSSADPVVILEAMKMELPVVPDVHATVLEVLVSAGQSVTAGQPVAVVRPTSQG
ncbi:urea carboxylase [Demequina sp. NBRC 110051]|uniref:urea carboxylase n=1 Tax=Demequina sp. NBRC 110051 TaxID=1570340 RepID=UPI000A044C93|nr:urea carboxylase [Demequina sp. NBRC 110051]